MGNFLPYNSPKDASASSAPDLLVKAMGAYGKYQLMVTILLFLTKFPIALNQMAIIFVGAKTKYTCDGVDNKCPCDNPVWDTSIFTKTIQMEWNLICGKKTLTSLNQSIFQFGVLIGSILFGMASDRYGRKYPLVLAVCLQTAAGVATAFAPDYISFTLFRFLIGFTSGGTMVVSFVTLMEFTGTKYRSTIAVCYQMPFNVGLMGLPLFSYFFRDFRYFQFVITIPSFFQLLVICFLSETPRWLIAMRKTERAVKVVEDVARMNKLPVDTVRADVQQFQEDAERHKLKKATLFDVFQYPVMRKNLIIEALNWFSCSYYFYGISQYSGQLSGNIFINVTLSTTVALFGSIMAFPFLRFCGRRTIVLINSAVCVVAMILLAVIPSGPGSVFCACLGIMSGFCIFVIVYLHCTEMFPTVVRNSAIGFCSMCARIGSMIAPFVTDLADVGFWVPPVCFAIPPLVAGIGCYFLPETAGCELTITLEQGEAFAKSGGTAK